jgi:hypothetical protein
MKALKLAVVTAIAAAALTGCCYNRCAPKCYPYPLYDYSPAKVCNNQCQPACASCPVTSAANGY